MSAETSGQTCPDCLAEIGAGCTTPEQLKATMARHLGSKSCKQNQEYAARILGMQAVAQGKVSTVIEPEDGDTDYPTPADARSLAEEELQTVRNALGGMPGAVTFESPMRSLQVWLRHPKTRYTPGGQVIDHDPGLRAQFRDNRFVTNDPEVIEAMRRFPTNEANIRKNGVRGTAVSFFKDRFYEVSSV